MTRARTVLVAGTASHVGKSTVAAGLCRLLADRGVDVAPFKAQNMSNNARVVPRTAAAAGRAEGTAAADGPGARGPADGAWGEIGVSQWVQARAARIPASTDHNPVLLKPRGDGESQLVVDGEALEHLAAGEYYDRHWEAAREAAAAAHGRLAARHDVIVAEGAGSIAEINLHDRDLANVETVRFADGGATASPQDGRAAEPRGVDVVLVADIERGGVFAALVGTLELLPDDVRERVAGAVVNKFRGDRSLLEAGLEEFEDRTGVPVLGVLPYDDPGLPEEDSLALPDVGNAARLGDDDVPVERSITIAVPRFPHASNVTDVEPLARVPGVHVEYVPLWTPVQGAYDAVVLTGTKNTVDDAVAAREAGLYGALRAFDGPIVGLCGGYQLLGERLANVGVESAGEGGVERTDDGDVEAASRSEATDRDVPESDAIPGVGLLPVETRFSPEKTVEPVERELRGCGPLAGGAGTVSGYEIHAGDTRLVGDAERPFPEEGAAAGDVLGTYLHGLFENRTAREAFVDTVYASAGRDRPASGHDTASPYERAADLVSSIDLEPPGLDGESTGGGGRGEDGRSREDRSTR